MVAAYIKAYGGNAAGMSSDVPEAFSVGEVTAQAVTKDGSLDQTKLISALHSATYDSVQGKVKFDSTGQNTAAFAYVFQWQKGALVPVQPDSSHKLGPVAPSTSVIEYPKAMW